MTKVTTLNVALLTALALTTADAKQMLNEPITYVSTDTAIGAFSSSEIAIDQA